MKKEQRKQHVQDVEKKRKRANRPRLGKEQKKARHHEDVPLGKKRESVTTNGRSRHGDSCGAIKNVGDRGVGRGLREVSR